MRVEFRDKNNSILTLTDYTSYKYFERPSSNDFTTNNKVNDRFAIDGGYEIGDGTIKSRMGNVGLTFISRTDLEYRQQANRIANFFKPEQAPFYIYDLDNQVRQKISYMGIESGYEHGQEMRFVKHSIKYTAIDPFFEHTSQTVVFDTLANNGILSIDLSDTNTASPNYNIEVYEAYPEINIDGNVAGTNSNFALTNLATGASFNIADSNFIAGQTIRVSAVTGLISKEIILNSRILKGGRPFKLVKGVNQILYQSAANIPAKIQFAYSPRYLY